MHTNIFLLVSEEICIYTYIPESLRFPFTNLHNKKKLLRLQKVS